MGGYDTLPSLTAPAWLNADPGRIDQDFPSSFSPCLVAMNIRNERSAKNSRPCRSVTNQDQCPFFDVCVSESPPPEISTRSTRKGAPCIEPLAARSGIGEALTSGCHPARPVLCAAAAVQPAIMMDINPTPARAIRAPADFHPPSLMLFAPCRLPPKLSVRCKDSLMS